MKAIFQRMASEYGDQKVHFFRNKSTGDLFIEEEALRKMSGLAPDAFAARMNRAEYKKAKTGQWVVSIVDAYLVLPEAPRAWVYDEQFRHLPLRLNTGSEHEAMLRSVMEQTRRLEQLSSLRPSMTSASRDRNMASIRTRIEKNIARLGKCGVNEHNSRIIRDARRAIDRKVRDADGTATL